ncbi:helix-turn-helix transcriptional regulator [Aquimarina sp. W85]|uniref:helix-turn-helix transcriptional regulator n=1 Tax=Aquimarina rhodophyticola TaxID=3342246 RepID=UPI00366EEFBE
MQFRVNTDTWFVFSILFIGALALFILLFVAIPYTTRIKQLKRIKLKYKRKQDTYKQLEEKYAERTIAQLKEENQRLQVNLKKDLQRILKYNTHEPDLLHFFSDFEKIYPKFKQTIQTLIPDITANELKLCALLRLNLSSKQISMLLNITPESVNKARYRLRKKMEIDSTDDLYIFLSNI